MIIPIDDDYRLDTDTYCWRVSKSSLEKDRKTGEKVEVWRPISYHGSPKQALKSLGARLLRDSEAKTAVEALKEVELITRKLSEALDVEIEA